MYLTGCTYIHTWGRERGKGRQRWRQMGEQSGTEGKKEGRYACKFITTAPQWYKWGETVTSAWGAWSAQKSGLVYYDQLRKLKPSPNEQGKAWTRTADGQGTADMKENEEGGKRVVVAQCSTHACMYRYVQTHVCIPMKCHEHVSMCMLMSIWITHTYTHLHCW